jgi:hypothetical protein
VGEAAPESEPTEEEVVGEAVSESEKVVSEPVKKEEVVDKAASEPEKVVSEPVKKEEVSLNTEKVSEDKEVSEDNIDQIEAN